MKFKWLFETMFTSFPFLLFQSEIKSFKLCLFFLKLIWNLNLTIFQTIFTLSRINFKIKLIDLKKIKLISSSIVKINFLK